MVQFLVRTNLEYYFTNFLLRNDHKHTLIAYPYALRTQLSRRLDNESTATHWRLEPSLDQLRKGNGTFDLQGEVYLRGGEAGETKETLAGLHRPEKFEAWVNRMRERGVLDDRLSTIGPRELTDADREELGLAYNAQVPAIGSCRIIQPCLPRRTAYMLEG